ncbi:MAG: hypothetical protein ACRC28_00420 [Clostridium sp.]|uniref:hypothetical protein n=1 Tax=Clostridium sp. TaxID=1506 RepID=UPI003F31106C
MEKVAKVMGYGVMKFFNMIVGVPLALAGTIVVLAFCLVDLILLLLPVFLVCQIMLEDVAIIVPNILPVQVMFTIVGTLMGYYLHKILKVYVPMWFKGTAKYISESFSFNY